MNLNDDSLDALITATHVATTWRVAAKDYRCGHCGHTIKAGTRYARDKWVVEGRFTELICHSPSAACQERS